jgi:hypothetical protein
VPISSFPNSQIESVEAHGMRPTNIFLLLVLFIIARERGISSFAVMGGWEGVYPCPQGFKKVLISALISRNRLIKKFPTL